MGEAGNKPGEFCPLPFNRLREALENKTAPVLCRSCLLMDPRGALVKTRQAYHVSLETPQSTVTNQINPDKQALFARAAELYKSGKSVREIGRELGIHWTRVHQLLKQKGSQAR